MKPSLTTVPIADLIADNAFQPRVQLNPDHIESMIHALLKDPATFDMNPIRVWKIGQILHVCDGFHRIQAYTRAEIKKVKVEIRETQRKEGISEEKHLENSRCEALQYAVAANRHHGSPLKRSRADNQRAIRLLLENPASRQFTDSVIAKLVGVSPPTVGTIRLENPEYQVEERIGSDGRSVIRKRLSSNSGNKVRMKAASTDVASLANGTNALATLDQETVEDAPGASQVSYIDDDSQFADDTDQDATLPAADTEEVNTFRDQCDAPIGASCNAKLEETPAALDSKAIEPDRILPHPKRLDVVTLSTLNTAEPQLHVQFQEVRQLWMPFRDEFLERYGVDIAICTLFAFGKAIFDHTQALMKEADRQRQRLELANPTAEIVSTRVKPAAKTKTKPTTKPNPAAKIAATHDVFDRVKTPNIHLSDDKPIKRRKRREKANFLVWPFG